MEFRRISPKCVIGSCPAVYETESGDLLIVGFIPTADESQVIASNKSGEEMAVRVPKSLIANLKF
mgnify:CR=1 FL=1